jgi:hypothetical protein
MQFAKYVKMRYEKFGAVVFDTLSEKVYITNDSGKEILSLMDEGLSASAIAERLARKHEEATSEMQNDVAEFIDGLQSAGLLASLVEEKP